jgi:hypothetical protein
MKKLIGVLLIIGTIAEAQVSVPFTSVKWIYASQDYQLTDYMGKASVLLKRNRLILKDAKFENGIIEYDVNFGKERGFIAVMFRMQDEQNYEEFYLRPHQSGNPDANQYTPVYGGVDAWQLYYGDGYGSPVNYSFNAWMHIKLVITGKYMEVYFDDMEKPAMLAELKRTEQSGYLGIQNGSTEAHYANFTYTAVDNVSLKGIPKPEASVALGTIMQWQVSNSMSEKSIENIFSLKSMPNANLIWKVATAENTGTLNLAGVVTFSNDRNTVLARVIINSDRDQLKKFMFGFSDRARVFFNNQLLYSGQDDFASRDYRFLGTIGYHDAVYLQLKKGTNTIDVAVSETFGGWAVKGKFDDVSGITFPK